MTVEELRTRLDAEDISPEAYCLTGGHPSERYTLRAPISAHPEQHERVALDASARNVWSVYYSERGAESDRRTFTTESDACAHLLDMVLRDRSARRATR